MSNKDKLIALLILLLVFLTGIYYYRSVTTENIPGENTFRLANKYLEDGENQEALRLFDEVLSGNPSYAEAYVGKAIALMALGRNGESFESFNKAISLNEKLASAFANRGILNDKMGNYLEAVSDYRKALEINPELSKGPGWLWRFLRNIPEKPPTIADRADYIEKELQKPEKDRLLRVPEIDSQQKMYKK